MDSDKLYSIINSSGLEAQFEVRVVESEECNLRVERGSFKSSDTINSKSIIIRSMYKGKSSSVIAHIASYNEIQNLLKKAYELAKNGSEDTQGRFSWKPHENISNPISKNIGDVEVSEMKTRLLSSVNGIASIDKMYSINAWLSYSSSSLHAANSSGVRGDWEGSYSIVSSNVIAKDGTEQASDSRQEEALDPYGLHFNKVFDESADIAVSMLNAQRAPTFKGMVLIAPETTASIISAFVDAMSGEEILKKVSFLTGKLGKTVASKLIDLSEKPYVQGSPFNRSFDDEIMPTFEKSLIKNGVLRTYLHNIYSSEKLHQEPTGNGFGWPGDFIGTTNLMLKPGRTSEEKLISRIKRGIYLLDTGDRPNMSTGDLSAMVSEGYYIESGEKKYPVKETMIGINMIDLMKNVVGVGSKVVGLGGVFSPAILVDKAQISGR